MNTPAAPHSPAWGSDPDARPTRLDWHWFLPSLAAHQRLWWEVLAASLALQALALLTPLLTQIVIDKVIVHRTVATWAVVAGALALAWVAQTLLGWWRQNLLLWVGQSLDTQLADTVTRHLLHLPLSWFAPRPTGVLMARWGGASTVRQFLAGAALSLLLDLPFALLLITLMAVYSPGLTAWVLVLLSLSVLLTWAYTPHLQKGLKAEFAASARVQAFLTERLAGMDTVKSLQMEGPIADQHARAQAERAQTACRHQMRLNTYQNLAQALDSLQHTGVLLLGAWWVMQGSGLSLGMLIAFQMLAGRLSQPFMRLIGQYQGLQEARLALGHLADVMDVPREDDAPGPLRPLQAALPPGPLAITVRGLGFRHDERRPWLYRHLDLALPAGSLTVLTGPSGCGKSTLTALLQGFYTPQEGQILVHGQDLLSLPSALWRARLGVVPQHTCLFSGTVADNLRWAAPHASDEALIQACEQVGLHATVLALPQGYDTPLQEGGRGLSGGQRQRLALARALLRQPGLLILDEATAHLDPVGAEGIAQTLNALRDQVTVLFITHRVPAGLRADARIHLMGTSPLSSPQPRTAA